MRNKNRGFTLTEVVIAILVITVISTVALSSVMLSTRRTQEALAELKVSSDVDSLLELTKTQNVESAVSAFTYGNYSAEKTAGNVIYTVFINEDLPEGSRYYKSATDISQGDTLYKFTISMVPKGTTLDGYDVWFVDISATEYGYSAENGFLPETDKDGTEKVFCSVGTTIVSEHNQEKGGEQTVEEAQQ